MGPHVLALLSSTNSAMPCLLRCHHVLYSLAHWCTIANCTVLCNQHTLVLSKPMCSSKVAQSAVQEISKKLFGHLLSLDHSFHLSRQTGAVQRAIDRGTRLVRCHTAMTHRGVNFMLTSIVFNVVPTVLEVSLVCGVLVRSHDVLGHVTTILPSLSLLSPSA